MTEQQKEFLRLHIIEQVKYEEITQILSVPRSTLTQWYEELKVERTNIASIRALWSRKKIKMEFREFYSWYLSYSRECFYCGITEEELNRLINGGKLYTKRLPTRGRRLEIDRKQPDLEYDNFDNLAFACYWCNNAKTDTFTEEEFKEVGKAFKAIWNKRLNL